MHVIYFTLIFVRNQNNVLLGLKKRGFGKNKWNGYGGKLEYKEDPFKCAIRELYEESNLNVKQEDLKYLGAINYYNSNQDTPSRIVYIFTTYIVSGNLLETDEMKPEWFNFEDIPYQDMWPDSKFWMPLVLRNTWLKANFIYNNDCEIISYTVVPLTGQSLPRVDVQINGSQRL